jgi:GNAT superfamily N-acetyltransferase
MQPEKYMIRNARQSEFEAIGQLMVNVYSQLAGFPTPEQQPGYYQMLSNIGNLTNKPTTELLVAVDFKNVILGAVVYFGDMQYYGSGGIATTQTNAAGFRLLAVTADARGKGVGRLLCQRCIDKARDKQLDQVLIHSTQAMQTAWDLYESMGFERAEALDFLQGELPVFGFRLPLKN